MMTNTETTIQTADLSTIIALDAVEASDPRAAALLVGCPATVGIGSDSYAARVVKATASLKTITVEFTGSLAGKVMTFRLTKRGYSNRSYLLSIGTAVSYWAPEV